MLSAYDELYAYTMGRPGFILQHVVDAQGAQSAAEDAPAVRLVFSLVGLSLRVEKRYSGHARCGDRRVVCVCLGGLQRQPSGGLGAARRAWFLIRLHRPRDSGKAAVPASSGSWASKRQAGHVRIVAIPGWVIPAIGC